MQEGHPASAYTEASTPLLEVIAAPPPPLPKLLRLAPLLTPTTPPKVELNLTVMKMPPGGSDSAWIPACQDALHVQFRSERALFGVVPAESGCGADAQPAQPALSPGPALPPSHRGVVPAAPRGRELPAVPPCGGAPARSLQRPPLAGVHVLRFWLPRESPRYKANVQARRGAEAQSPSPHGGAPNPGAGSNPGASRRRGGDERPAVPAPLPRESGRDPAAPHAPPPAPRPPARHAPTPPGLFPAPHRCR